MLGIGAEYEWLIAPTGDINLPLAMALFVIVLVHVASIRARGVTGYVRHYLMQPFPVYLMPVNLFINLVEEIAKPITLALRLFGNLLVRGADALADRRPGGLEARARSPSATSWSSPSTTVWKLFDVWPSGASRPSSSPCSPSCTSTWP